ncbi:MAG: hypothetical protein MI976_31415, partial [Pseudomonadales bacterium]|nr:hypothetical protein [Pseudomonadales bacterium]
SVKPMKKIIALIAAINLVPLAHACGEYIVTSKIYSNGKMIGAPLMIVESNKEASTSISDLYSYTITVNPVNESSAVVSTHLNIDGRKLSPQLTVEIGKEAGVEIENQKLSILVSKSRS